jgi:hypothetical protein
LRVIVAPLSRLALSPGGEIIDKPAAGLKFFDKAATDDRSIGD